MIDILIVFITHRHKTHLQLFNFLSLERNATGSRLAQMFCAVKIHKVLQQKVTKPTQWNVTGAKGLVTSENIK